MAKNNFLNLLKPKANIGRNGFDLSQKHVFHQNPGAVLPVTCTETLLDDYFEFDLSSMQRTQTFSTASMVRGKFYYEFYFVPFTQIWNNFHQFYNQRNDQHSTAFGNFVNCPVVSLTDMLDTIWDMRKNDRYNASQTSAAKDAISLLDMLGYGDYSVILTFDKTDDTQYDNYVYYWKHLRQGVYVNVFRLAAYHHICYDRMRNKFFQAPDFSFGNNSEVPANFPNGQTNNYYNVNLWNFDDVPCNDLASSIVTNYRPSGWLNAFLSVHDCPWKMDLFTSALPSTQFGSVSSIDLNKRFIYTDSASTLSTTDRAAISTTDHSLIIRNSGNTAISDSGTWTIPNAFDVLNLRKAELLQRWKQNTMRAGNMVDDQFRAHFGMSPSTYQDKNVEFLGSFEGALQVNPVEGTVNSATSQIGGLGATGTAVANGSKIRFHSRDFGVVMSLCYFRPDAEYRATMIDKMNTKFEQFDFYTPEFENIGLQPITTVDYDFTDFQQSFMLGYAPNYWEYKTAIDKVHNGFYLSSLAPSGTVAAPFAHWVAPRVEKLTYITALQSPARNINTFYVPRTIYNSVFGVDAGITPHFICNVYVDIKAIRPMSELGLPQF